MTKRIVQIVLVGLVFQVSATVYLNQMGFQPEGFKTCYSDVQATNFALVNTTTGDTVHTGSLIAQGSDTEITGLSLYRGDFTSFKESGEYKIVINEESSYPFSISNTLYSELKKTMIRSFYLNRCGSELKSAHAGEYARPSCHTHGAKYHWSTGEDTTTILPISGGWHDAGDYGRYVVPASHTLYHMLNSYAWFPEFFPEDDLNIPESNNGTPDLLDEIRYELNWMITMQRLDGAVHHKVTTDPYIWAMPEDDPHQMYIHNISTNATANFAAVMALASRIYSEFDADFAAEILDASIKAWSFLETNPSTIPSGGFSNPSTTKSGQYPDATDSDERLWAAIELFSTTKDSTYLTYIEGNKPTSQYWASNGWGSIQMLAVLAFVMNENNATETPSLYSELETYMRTYATYLQNTSFAHPFGNSLLEWQYTWGSNGSMMNNGLILGAMGRRDDNNDYLAAAQYHLDYMVGGNATSYSFVTGVGTKSPLNVHHAVTEFDGVDAPFPGLVANGPNKKLNDNALKEAFDPDGDGVANVPPALCYVDHINSYAANEPTIYASSPLVFLAGILSEVDDSTIVAINESQSLDTEASIVSSISNRKITLRTGVGKVNIKLHSPNGRQLLAQTIHDNVGTFHIPSNISTGVYFLSVTTSTEAVKLNIMVR